MKSWLKRIRGAFGMGLTAGYVATWWLMGFPPDGAAVQWLATPTLLGAASASGSLALARAADDRELLEEGEQTAGIGLSPDERRTLLGDS